MERAREESRPGDERPAAEAAPPGEAAEPGGVRCPYCHETMPYGEAAAACDACKAPHHAGCFAEHRGCAATGCAGQTASAVVLRPRPDPRPKCGTCAGALEPESWVAWCGCGWIAHGECTTDLRCPRAACRRAPRLGTLEFLRASRRLEGLRPALALTALAMVAALGIALAGVLGLLFRDLVGLPHNADVLASLLIAFLGGGLMGGVLGLGLLRLREDARATEDELRRLAARPRPASPEKPAS